MRERESEAMRERGGVRVGETEQTTRERDNERERGRECVRDPTLERV